MKSIIRHYIFDTLSLFLISRIVSGMVFANGMYTLLLAGLVLMISTLVVKPLINLLILPINLVTFGLFKWVASVVALYVVTLVVPGFEITGMSFAGYSGQWIDIPSFNFTGVLAFVAFSFAISLFSSVMHWLVK